MPNKPRPENPVRPVRVEDGLWRAAKAIAAERGESLSNVMREALRRYVKRYGDPSQP
jgi:predicted transcriptional regulator